VDAERAVARFAENGRTGVVLRLGLLYGPGTGSDTPAERYASFGATLHIDDAGRALAAALEAPSGVYNVVGNGQRVSNERFKAATSWHPNIEPTMACHASSASAAEARLKGGARRSDSAAASGRRSLAASQEGPRRVAES
jgi:hypothetical protein